MIKFLKKFILILKNYGCFSILNKATKNHKPLRKNYIGISKKHVMLKNLKSHNPQPWIIIINHSTSQLINCCKFYRTKSWNYAPNPDKDLRLQRQGKLKPVEIFFTDFAQRRRAMALQSVDVAVEKVSKKYIHLKMLKIFNK